MKQNIENITTQESKNFEKQLTKNLAAQKKEGDVLALILNKISRLEEKVERIEHQTKTHWVN